MQRDKVTDDDGFRMLDLLLTPPEPAPEPEAAKPDRSAPLGGLEKLIKQRAPTQEQLEQLTKQVEALTAEVERLTKLKLPRPPKPPSPASNAEQQCRGDRLTCDDYNSTQTKTHKSPNSTTARFVIYA